jgi:hypothetical protein
VQSTSVRVFHPLVNAHAGRTHKNRPTQSGGFLFPQPAHSISLEENMTHKTFEATEIAAIDFRIAPQDWNLVTHEISM